jgi:hypothetical protein
VVQGPRFADHWPEGFNKQFLNHKLQRYSSWYAQGKYLETGQDWLTACSLLPSRVTPCYVASWTVSLNYLMRTYDTLSVWNGAVDCLLHSPGGLSRKSVHGTNLFQLLLGNCLWCRRKRPSRLYANKVQSTSTSCHDIWSWCSYLLSCSLFLIALCFLDIH